MKSSKLPPVLDISSFSADDEIYDFLYGIFRQNFIDTSNRRSLSGINIFFDFNKRVNDKCESFWHLISLGPKEKFHAVLPCINDIVSLKCVDQNCNSELKQIRLSSGPRNICYYRATRFHWITEIINLAEKSDPNIKKWVNKDKLHIRFQHETTDFVLVFTITKRSFIFNTGFPVFYQNKKKDFDKQYTDYLVLSQTAVTHQ